MFSTSSLYFLVAIYGESIETNKEVHGLQLVHGQGQEVTEPGHNENQEKAQNQVDNESNESVEQRLKEGQEEQVPQMVSQRSLILKATNPNIFKVLKQRKHHMKNQLLKPNAGTWNFHFQ